MARKARKKELEAPRQPENFPSDVPPADANETAHPPGMFRDRDTLLAHLHETQQLLELSRDRYADLYDYAPVGYVTLTSRGQIVEANIAFAEMVGYAKKTLLHMPFNLFLASSQELLTFVSHLRRCRHADGKIVTELCLKHPSGKELEVELSSVTVPDYGSRAMLYRTAVMDISDRKQAQRIMQQANEELERRVQERTAELARSYESLAGESEARIQAVETLRMQEKLMLQQSRLAAMGEMIGNIAHQWRQPLNTLGLLFQSLPLEFHTGVLTEESLDASVGQAMRVINHMSQTINDFRDFYKPDKTWVSFELKDALTTALTLIAAGLQEQHVKVDLQCQDGLLTEGNPNEYGQAIINIMMNARDALRERQVSNPAITIRCFREGAEVVVTIADNAGGIPQEILDRIFDPYFTTKDQGTGIGLFMSKMIIEKNLHGSLTVQNIPPGASFRIALKAS